MLSIENLGKSKKFSGRKMAKVTDQTIPAGILDSYTKLLLPAKSNGHILGTVEKRPPFTQPTWRGFIVDLPTLAQVYIRQKFKRSTICFGCQPQTGGVEPPAIGPRSREWWYNECGAYDVDYYRYFMHMTIPPFLAENTPDWCNSGGSIAPIEVLLGDTRQGGSEWQPPETSWGDVWNMAVEMWKNNPFTYQGYAAGFWGIKMIDSEGGKKANIIDWKCQIRFDLKNIGEFDPAKVVQAWLEMPSTYMTEYANKLACNSALGEWKAGVVECYDVTDYFGNDNVVFDLSNDTLSPGAVEPPNPENGYKVIKKGGLTDSESNARIKFLCKD
ncbi:hypothetical protein ES703_30971 [subsurface metagenome]